MRDLSLFLLKNSLSSRMRRGIRSFCHGVGSTSTLEQHKADGADNDASFLTVPSVAGSCVAESDAAPALTLEQMILQLDLEEEAARKARHEEYYHGYNCGGGEDPYRRMSCVNSSDHVLRSARDALSQYPRFSLDGRDAMYRASFSGASRDVGSAHHRGPACCAGGCRARACADEGYEMDLERTLRMPATVAGESVVWCKPNVVARLMGLDVVPVPVGGGRRRRACPVMASGRRQRLRRLGRQELEKERLLMALHGCSHIMGSCRAGSQANLSPLGVAVARSDADHWQFRRPR